MPSTRRTAGIHLDGAVATLVRIDLDKHQVPTVVAVHQVNGFSGAEALTRALALIDPAVELRVTFTSAGVAATPVDLTPATLDRAGFTTAARRAFVNLHPSAAVAGVVPDAQAVLDGQIVTGLAVAAPGDVVTGLYKALAAHPHSEVTTCAVAHGPLDGLHLAVRRVSVELTWVRHGRPTLSAVLDVPGADELTAQLGIDRTQTAAVMAGATSDPGAAVLIREWLVTVAAAVAAARNEWALLGHDTGTDVLVHGKAATAQALDALLSDQGLRKQPHPLVGLPHDAPLDAVDAYYAALTARTLTPLATFYHPDHPSTHGDQASDSRRARRGTGRARRSTGQASPSPAAATSVPNAAAAAPLIAARRPQTTAPAAGRTIPLAARKKPPAAPRPHHPVRARAVTAATVGCFLAAASVAGYAGYERYTAAEQLRISRDLAATPGSARAEAAEAAALEGAQWRARTVAALTTLASPRTTVTVSEPTEETGHQAVAQFTGPTEDLDALFDRLSSLKDRSRADAALAADLRVERTETTLLVTATREDTP